MIPKAELHCHLEGSIPPALARELAARNGLGVPPGLIGEHGHYVWKDFLSFLATYDLVCTTLRTARDFGDVIYSYLASVARQGAVYVEMFCSPERPAALGITYNAWLEALEGGIDRARRDFGIEGRIIIICIRHLGPERALAMARKMVAEPHHYVVGFGMGGDEDHCGRVLQRAQVTRQLNSAHAGHLDVEQQHLGRAPGKAIDHVQAAVRFTHHRGRQLAADVGK